MSIVVDIHEARTQLSRLLDQAHAGQEIVLTKAGKPYARLLPLVAGPGQRRPGRLPGKLDDSFFEPLPAAEIAAWEPR
jgi:prevent-host-death family protein